MTWSTLDKNEVSYVMSYKLVFDKHQCTVLWWSILFWIWIIACNYASFEQTHLVVWVDVGSFSGACEKQNGNENSKL